MNLCEFLCKWLSISDRIKISLTTLVISLQAELSIVKLMTDDQDLRTEFPTSLASDSDLSFKRALKPKPISNVTSDHHMVEVWDNTRDDKGWLKSYENIFSFWDTITCDRTDFYLRWLNESGAFTLFISLRNLTTMVQGLTLATLSTLWKQLSCYEKFPAITITAWHVVKINKMSYINCWTLIMTR